MTAPGTAVATRDEQFSAAEAAPLTSLVRQSDVLEFPTIEEARRAIAARNEKDIMRAAEGEMIKEWVYEFKVGGTMVQGLGSTGAMEVARIRAEQGFPIQFRDREVVEVMRNGELGVQAIVNAREVRTGGEGMGIAFYPWYLKKRDGTSEYDRYADRKALSVAKRNAVLDIIPEVQVLALLKKRAELIAANERRVSPGQPAPKQVASPRPQAAAPAPSAPAPVAAKPPVEPTAHALASAGKAEADEAAAAAGADAAGLVKPIAGDVTPATQQQIDKLLAFANLNTLPEETRQTILDAVAEGLSFDRASRWIPRLTILAREAIATQQK